MTLFVYEYNIKFTLYKKTVCMIYFFSIENYYYYHDTKTNCYIYIFFSIQQKLQKEIFNLTK